MSTDTCYSGHIKPAPFKGPIMTTQPVDLSLLSNAAKQRAIAASPKITLLVTRGDRREVRHVIPVILSNAEALAEEYTNRLQAQNETVVRVDVTTKEI